MHACLVSHHLLAYITPLRNQLLALFFFLQEVKQLRCETGFKSSSVPDVLFFFWVVFFAEEWLASDASFHTETEDADSDRYMYIGLNDCDVKVYSVDPLLFFFKLFCVYISSTLFSLRFKSFCTNMDGKASPCSQMEQSIC